MAIVIAASEAATIAEFVVSAIAAVTILAIQKIPEADKTIAPFDFLSQVVAIFFQYLSYQVFRSWVGFKLTTFWFWGIHLSHLAKEHGKRIVAYPTF